MGQKYNKTGKKKKQQKKKKSIIANSTISTQTVANKISPSPAIANNPAPDYHFFNFSPHYFQDDLKRTAISAAIIIVILLIIFFVIK